jgi:hypothetical protein
MSVPLEKRSKSYRRILAMLVSEGPKTKAELMTSLDISMTCVTECLSHAIRDERAYVKDYRKPEKAGLYAKIYAFGQGVTPPQPKIIPPKNIGRRDPEEAAKKSRDIAARTIERARATATAEFNPFASLLSQV